MKKVAYYFRIVMSFNMDRLTLMTITFSVQIFKNHFQRYEKLDCVVLTLQSLTKNSLVRAGFELASLGGNEFFVVLCSR